MKLLSKAKSQLDNQRKSADAKQSIIIRTVQLLESAKRVLISSLQEELRDNIEVVDTNNKFKESTIKQLIHAFKDNELHVPKANNWA